MSKNVKKRSLGRTIAVAIFGDLNKRAGTDLALSWSQDDYDEVLNTWTTLAENAINESKIMKKLGITGVL